MEIFKYLHIYHLICTLKGFNQESLDELKEIAQKLEKLPLIGVIALSVLSTFLDIVKQY